MIMLIGVRTKVICFKNILKCYDNGSIFTRFIVQTNIQTVGQILNYRIITLLIMVPPRKRKLLRTTAATPKK